MSVFEDVRHGLLVQDKLAEFLDATGNPHSVVLNTLQDPDTGWSLLATAAAAGRSQQVNELLQKGALVYVRCRDGETALLLAVASRSKMYEIERIMEIERIVQSLITAYKTAQLPRPMDITDNTGGGGSRDTDSSFFIDASCAVFENKTPLMLAIEQQNIWCIYYLLWSGASPDRQNDHGLNATQMAEQIMDERKRVCFTQLVNSVQATNRARAVKRPYRQSRSSAGLSQAARAPLVSSFSDALKCRCISTRPVHECIQNRKVLGHFFKNWASRHFYYAIARNAADLNADQQSVCGRDDLLPKTIQVAMHQHVIFCDDSSLTRHGARWDSLAKLIRRMASVTTCLLPASDGVALYFTSESTADTAGKAALSARRVEEILDKKHWGQGCRRTDMGTSLESMVLEPLVYAKLPSKKFRRPLLVTLLVGSTPHPDERSRIARVMQECGSRLAMHEHPRDSVKFMFGQVGTAPETEKFLASLRADSDVSSVTYFPSGSLDKGAREFGNDTEKIDEWLTYIFYSCIEKTSIK